MITDYIPKITEKCDRAGFIHPGIGVSAEQLRIMQRHARAGDEPWKSSFALLSSHPRASVDAKIEYREGDPDYVTVPFGDGGLQVAMKAQHDCDTASKQALMYISCSSRTLHEDTASMVADKQSGAAPRSADQVGYRALQILLCG